MMDDRVYILLDVVGGKADQAIEILRKSPGVVMADILEGPPDVIMVMEVPGRQKLAKLTIQALASVETVIENVRLLPARDRLNEGVSIKLSSRSKGKNGNGHERGRQIRKGG